MPYFRLTTETNDELAVWIQTIEMEIGHYRPLYERNIVPRRGGEIRMKFLYSPETENLIMCLHDTRRKNIVVSTEPNGRSFNVFKNVLLQTYQISSDDNFAQFITTEVSFIFENSTATLHDFTAIINRNSTHQSHPEDHISWKKYGF